MEIKPKYVTFEQAKWLKDKGFHEETFQSYRTIEHTEERLNWWKVGELNKPMYCKLSDSNDAYYGICSAPEQWQVVEFLRVNHGIWVSVILNEYDDKFQYTITQKKNNSWYVVDNGEHFNSPQEAYSAAFDYIISNNLI